MATQNQIERTIRAEEEGHFGWSPFHGLQRVYSDDRNRVTIAVQGHGRKLWRKFDDPAKEVARIRAKVIDMPIPEFEAFAQGWYDAPDPPADHGF